MKMRGLHLVLLVLISGLIGYTAGVNKIEYQWAQYRPHITIQSKEPPSNIQTADFTLFWTVWDRLQKTYYDKSAIDSQKLLNGAISGMVAGLDDPYTTYLPPTQNEDFKQGMAGRFEGIGAELGLSGKQLVVIAPIDGSPAQKAGIVAGDAILRVNGQPTAGWTVTQAVDKIRGPKGSEVSLDIMRKNDTKSRTIKITRATITVKSVEGWVKNIKDIDRIDKNAFSKNGEDDIVYIRLSQFGDQTNEEWSALVSSLDLKAKGQGVNTKGVILDLRNNPGGYLPDAVFVASEFVKSGVIVTEEHAGGEKIDRSVPINRNGLFTSMPVVVLINKGSASASEIVAGALRDHQRATLVGETSFGKGTIQQAEDLGQGAGLHVTIAKWLTPKGTWVHGKGLTPDVVAELDLENQSKDTQLEQAIKELLK